MTKSLPEANPETEALVLARAMARARRSMIEFYEKHEMHDKTLALKKVLTFEQDPEWQERLTKLDPDQLTWFGLNSLAASGREDVAALLWQSAKQEALAEFESGHRAAKIIAPQAQPMQRARFIAIRDAFREDWQPRGATELALVDQLAQMHWMHEKWLETHIQRLMHESYRDVDANTRALEEHKWLAPRQNEAEATREAAEMADRWQKAFLRTVRALRDLRRYSQSVVIQNAEQVNVGSQQINVAS